MTDLTKTKTQLEELGYPWIGIQLRDGQKLFGKVTKFTQFNIYFQDKHGDELDVPRRLIVRALLCLNGGKNESAEFSTKDKPHRSRRRTP